MSNIKACYPSLPHTSNPKLSRQTGGEAATRPAASVSPHRHSVPLAYHANDSQLFSIMYDVCLSSQLVSCVDVQLSVGYDNRIWALWARMANDPKQGRPCRSVFLPIGPRPQSVAPRCRQCPRPVLYRAAETQTRSAHSIRALSRGPPSMRCRLDGSGASFPYPPAHAAHWPSHHENASDIVPICCLLQLRPLLTHHKNRPACSNTLATTRPRQIMVFHAVSPCPRRHMPCRAMRKSFSLYPRLVFRRTPTLAHSDTRS